MSDHFGICLSEPNSHQMTKLIDLFNQKLIKNNGLKLDLKNVNINYANLLEGKWIIREIAANYADINDLNVCLKNHQSKCTIEFAFEFTFMSVVNDSLGIQSDCFEQTISSNTGVKNNFEVRKCLKIYSEEYLFSLNGKAQKVMMTINGKISFAHEAQLHDWNFEISQNDFINPESVQELADNLQRTILGSHRRSRFGAPATSTPGRPGPSHQYPNFDPQRPPPSFHRRKILPHIYDSISSSTSEANESSLGAKQKKKTKRVMKQNEVASEEQTTEYTMIFRKNPATEQEAVIKKIIENLDMLRKNDREKSITKETFENLTKSIFQPLSDIADKLDLDVEKEKSNDTSEPIQEVTIREDEY